MGREKWEKCSLENCVEIFDSKRIPLNSRDRLKIKGHIPYYGATGIVDHISKYIFNEELVLLGEDGAPFLDKKKQIAYIINGKSWVNNHAHVLKAKINTSNQFIKYYLNYFDFSGFVNGTTRLKLTQEKMRKIPIPLPPLNEQKRIVEKLDAILPKVKKARSRLQKIPVLLKKFRQSVLSSACSGKLTEDWREGKDLLTYFLLDESKFSLRKYKEDLPDNWKIFSFNDVCTIATNLVNPSQYKYFPHIAPDNIEKETGRLLNYNTIEQDRVMSAKHRFFKGQIIYSKIRPYLSKAIIADFDGLCSADMYPLTSKINTKFLYFYILSNIFLELASSAGDRSVLPKINQKELCLIPVPVPSKEEQNEIVRRVEKLFALADSLEEKYKTALEKIDKLEQSILSKAFRGELVGSDPNDESAEELLEKILEEKKKFNVNIMKKNSK